jgi:hypothetical protein
MLKASTLALIAATIIGSSAVQAQTIQLGPSGPAVDLRSERQRDRDMQREEMRREREMDRRRADRELNRRDRDMSTGSTSRCRTITVRERDDNGRMVSRRTEECRN